MNKDMKFDNKLLLKKNFFFVTHHVFFNRIFDNFKPANFMHSHDGIDIKSTDFGKQNTFLAGDCGAYRFGYSYIETHYKSNKFICTGLGSGWADNVYDLEKKKPIFFNQNGKIKKFFCLSAKGKFENSIKVCLPYHINSLYMVVKFYKNILF